MVAADLPAPLAVVGGRVLTDLVDVTDDLAALDGTGTWAVVLPFTGAPVCARFARSRPARPWPGPPWPGVPGGTASWATSLDGDGFRAGVRTIREAIAAGDVYQVNLTRRLSAPAAPDADVAALGAALAVGNPAPFSAVVRLPAHGVHVASASPELFLERDGDRIRSSPIKGTAATADAFLAKDRAENVMIVDLVRNDLGRVCEWGSISVPALCAVEAHPGLVHLVSTVEGNLRPGAGWAEAIGATFPPGSVTGAPKVAALGVIDALEPVARGVYCGAVGWVDAGARRGALNVAIRTFWLEEGRIHFGTGGGITWGSDPDGEWAETELKARRLIALTSRERLGTMSDPSPSWCWLNGAVTPTREATVGVTDHGLTVGDGVFETMKVVGRTPFALTRHLARLHRSATALGLDVPLGDDALRAACSEVLAAAAAAGDEVGRIRLTVTGGPGPSGSERGDGGRTVLLVTGGPAVWEVATAVATVPFTRNPTGALAGVKSTSYAENVLALARAHAVGASEAIFADVDGHLSEGTGSNVFVVRDGALLTPSLRTGCLAGITRELVLELTGAREVDDLTLDDLRGATEAFLTSSTRDVQAVATVDGAALPAPHPGPVTSGAAAAFAALEARTLDP